MNRLERRPTFFQDKHEKHFSISMHNTHICEGKMWQEILKSDYTREVIFRPMEQVAFYKYTLLKTTYKDYRKGKNMVFSFAQGLSFYHVLYSLKNKEERDKLIHMGKAKDPLAPIEDVFTHLPKLPSVYLVMMQIYDIIGLQAFCSFIYSKDWICNNWTEIKSFSNQGIDMGLQKGKEKSIYQQNAFYMNYLGRTNEEEIFEYQADPAETSFQLGKSQPLKNYSIYDGNLFLSREDLDLSKGQMKEVVLAKNKEGKSTYRKIYLEKVEERSSGDKEGKNERN